MLPDYLFAPVQVFLCVCGWRRGHGVLGVLGVLDGLLDGDGLQSHLCVEPVADGGVFHVPGRLEILLVLEDERWHIRVRGTIGQSRAPEYIVIIVAGGVGGIRLRRRRFRKPLVGIHGGGGYLDGRRGYVVVAEQSVAWDGYGLGIALVCPVTPFSGRLVYGAKVDAVVVDGRRLLCKGEGAAQRGRGLLVGFACRLALTPGASFLKTPRM